MRKFKTTFVYNVHDIRVVDGDTLEATIDLGFHISFKTKLRLYGINCPELSTNKGKKAKAFVEQMINGADKVQIQTIKNRQGKYGRYLAIVYIYKNGQAINLNKLLLDKGLAREYK